MYLSSTRPPSITLTQMDRHMQKLAGYLQEKLPGAPKNYYTKTSCNIPNDFEFSNVSEKNIKKGCG